MKSKLQKKKDNPRSKYWQTKADELWKKIIREKWQSCAVNNDCKGNLDAHHLIGRANKITRHNPENGILLCSKHHVFDNKMSAHGAPLAFAEFVQKKYPDIWEWCSENKHNMQKPDYEEAFKDLQGWCIENAPHLI